MNGKKVSVPGAGYEIKKGMEGWRVGGGLCVGVFQRMALTKLQYYKQKKNL